MEDSLLLFQTHPEIVILKYFSIYEQYKSHPSYIITQKMFRYIYEKENNIWSILNNIEKGELIQHAMLLSNLIIQYLIDETNYRRISSVYYEITDEKQRTIQHLILKER